MPVSNETGIFIIIKIGAFVLETLFVQTETLSELVYTAAGINQLLLTGVEGVTSRTNFNTNILFRRAGLDDITAGAFDGGLLIIGMKTLFHDVSPLSIYKVSHCHT